MSWFAESNLVGTDGITCNFPVVSASQARSDAAEADRTMI